MTPEQQEQVRNQYNHNGYLITDLNLDNAHLQAIKQDMQTIRINHSSPIDLWQYSDSIMNLAYHPAILYLLQTLYQRRAFPFQTLNYWSSPEQGLHSDMIHFNSQPMGYMCGVWVALEPITNNNGPLYYYPESHKLPFTTFQDLNLTPTTETKQFQRNLGHYTRWLMNCVSQHNFQRQLFTADTGQILIWSANMLHGSIKKNYPNTTRASQVTHYFFDNCTYYTPAFSSCRS